jgi:hypothetical protein
MLMAHDYTHGYGHGLLTNIKAGQAAVRIWLFFNNVVKACDKMEHRWSIRKHMQASVTLALPSWEKLQANIHDISLGGLAIMCPDCSIPVNTLATLSFSLERDSRVSYHRLLSQVVYSGNTRIGFLFVEPGREDLHALRDMLYPPAVKLSDSIAGQPYAA